MFLFENLKTTWFWLGFFFSILAILALVAVPKIDKEKEPAVFVPIAVPATEEQLPERTFDKERNIAFSAYQLFLVNRFSIEKNSTLDKFVIEEDVFDTLENALRNADSRYSNYLTAQDEHRHRQARDLADKIALESSERDALRARLVLKKIQSDELHAKLEPLRQAKRKKVFILSIVSLTGIVIGVAFWRDDYFSESNVEERLVRKDQSLAEENARIWSKVNGQPEK